MASALLIKVGDVMVSQGDSAGALAAYREALTSGARLPPEPATRSGATNCPSA